MGLPENSLIFFFGILLLPPLAGMTATFNYCLQINFKFIAAALSKAIKLALFIPISVFALIEVFPQIVSAAQTH
jgi:hypothetical protein